MVVEILLHHWAHEERVSKLNMDFNTQYIYHHQRQQYYSRVGVDMVEEGYVDTLSHLVYTKQCAEEIGTC